MLIHVVKPGESLWQIANYYHVTLASIEQVNGLPNANQLVIGEALVVPTEDMFHVVMPGESLWRIARNYGISVQTILQYNPNINPANILQGTAIYIPALKHTVQRGESLYAIAQRYNVSLQDLQNLNKIQNPSQVYPGMVLVIPRRPRPNIYVNGYIYIPGEAAVPIVREDGAYLTYLSPFAYLIKEDGSLQPIQDTQAIQAAQEERVVPVMAITNFTSTATGGNLAHSVLTSPKIIDTLLSNYT